MIQFALSGQRFRTEFEYLSAADGLAQNHVFKISQDEDGFMWFCTMGGLSKYDGFRFTNYYFSEEDTSSISSNYTYQFFRDSKGRYWVTTNNGLNLMDRKTGKFRRYQHNKNNPLSPGHNMMREITEDREGNLWIVHHKGVDRFNPEHGTFEHFTDDSFEVGRHSGSVCIDSLGQVWVTGVKGFYKVLLQEKKLLKYENPDIRADVPLEGRKIYLDSNGKLWVGFNRGLSYYDPDTDRLNVLDLGLNDVNVIDMTEYPRGIMVIGTAQGGFAVYNLQKQSLINNFSYSPSDPKGLSGSTVYSFYADRDKNLWIGLFSGINRINPYRQRFALLEYETGFNNYINYTLLIHQDYSNGIWANTMEGLLYKKNLYTPYKSVLPYPEFRKGHNDVISMESDDTGNVYFNIRHNGLFRYNTASDKLDRLKFGDYFVKNYVNKLKNDVSDKNLLWFAGNDGIGYFHKRSLDTVIFRPKNFLPDIGSNIIYRFAQSPDRKIYFVNTGRLYELDVKANAMRECNRDFLIKGGFYAITYLDNCLWIGTTENVYKYNLIHHSYDIIRREDGVKYLKSIGIQTDAYGSIWSVSGSEVTWIDPATCEVKHYHSPTPFVNGIGSTAPTGFALFGGANGALLVGDKRMLDTLPPKVILSGFEIANQPVAFGIENEYVHKATLNYEDKVFTLRYAAVNFIDRNYIRYLYKLEGFDENWVDAGTRREVTYTNLRPGNYTFKVVGINEDGIRSVHPLSVDIFIRPPFYLTLPFFIFVFALISALVYVYYRINRKASLLSKEKELAEKNARYKTLFMANMSHEIRTPMNAIIGLNRLLLDTPLNKKQEEYVKAIQQSGENLLWIINDILDQAKIESGKYTIVQKVFEPGVVLHQLESLLGHRAAEKNLSFSIQIHDTLPAKLVGDQVRLFQILTNLLSNAIKFTEKGFVNLHAYVEERNERNITMLFEVEDSGIGIPADKLDKIFESFEQLSEMESSGNQGTGLGLSIVKNLVEQLGGLITVRSSHGEGSVFIVKLGFDLPEEEAHSEHSNGKITLPASMHILIAEDTPFNQLLAVELLKKYMPQVKTEIANNGSVALEKLQQSREYDLVLMDVKMPVMDGLEATGHIRTLKGDYYKQLPIIGLTASAIPQQVQACLDAGMNDCVTKPINPEELIYKISKHLKND
jgi:signal transduction histidine kinase/CheY-like chemotaxis protein/ligand-binding sensor domain-containing protein